MPQQRHPLLWQEQWHHRLEDPVEDTTMEDPVVEDTAMEDPAVEDTAMEDPVVEEDLAAEEHPLELWEQLDPLW